MIRRNRSDRVVKRWRSLGVIFLSCLGGELSGAQTVIRTHTIGEGITFSTLDPGGERLPTILVLAAERDRTLREDQFMKFGHIMARSRSCLFVSIDAPGHGDDRRRDERGEGLQVWRSRLDRNEDFVAPFVQRSRTVLDHLIEQRRTDPKRIAVAGTSRGGYLALHVAAANPQISAVALFSGVTELTVLGEFKGLESHALTRSLAVANLADALAGRPIWHCIGNQDMRVGTTEAFAFFRLLVNRGHALHGRAPVELHIMESEGHRTPAGAWSLAADWLLRQLDGA